MRNAFVKPTIVFLILSVLIIGCAYERRTTTVNLVANPVPELLSYQPKNVWSFRVLNAKIPPRKRSGLDWESDGTQPDPFVRLYVNDRKVWESEVKENTTSPEWNVTLPRNVEISPEALLRLELWDMDTVASADPIGQLKRRGLPPTARPDAKTRLMLDTGAILTISVFAPRTHQGIGILSYEVHKDCLHVLEVERYSPAGRAGITPGECIVEIDGMRVESLEDRKAMSMISMATKREYELKIANSTNVERTIKLDPGYIWLTM